MSAAHPSKPLVRFGRLLLVLSVCASLGMHWAALQAVAWTQMLVTYSQNADFGEAVKKTFDGEHPCDLCQIVTQGQDEQKRQEAAPLAKKLDAVLLSESKTPLRFARVVEFPITTEQAVGWMESPPIPPPRA